VPRILAAVIALFACAPAADPPSARVGGGRGAVQVRLATWNLHDLFDADDRLIPPGDDDTVPAPAEVDEKLARLAAVLLRIDADLVLVQEVENRGLLARLAAASGYSTLRLVEGNDPRGIDVGLLSRLPVRAYASHADEVGTDGRRLWPRDCVEAHADATGRRVVVVGSHLSSSLSDDGTRRARQAARLRQIADEVMGADPAAVVVAGGDLNDAPASPALASLLGDGAWRDPLPSDATTWQGPATSARLDYLLVGVRSPAVVAAAWVEGGADVASASDHRPVVLDLLVE
jgi:endonuclease/exonuclease/phosphatase family metal-dependent hydrolase